MPGKICPQCGEEYELTQRFCSRDGAVLTTPLDNDSLEGKIIAGRYQVLRTLGEGGMGQVYLAEQVRMKRKCALKVMHPLFASDPDAIARFNIEAENASHVSHPNVAAIYDFGDGENGLIYLAMEYIDGGSLADVLKDNPSVPPGRAADIIRQTADALQAVHDSGITHRDLKPENIMLKRMKSGGDQVKLVDFGISKIQLDRGQSITVTGAIVGTPAYMSPEQVRAESLDARSDVFSLGIVAFKMLTGAMPFVGDSSFESMASRLNDPPRRLSEARRDFKWGPTMEAVIARALATKPEDRYQTAPDFARDFEAAVGTIPVRDVDTVLYVPDTKVGLRRTRSRPKTVLAATVALVIVGGGISLGVTMFTRSHPPAVTDTTTKLQGVADRRRPDAAGDKVVSDPVRGRATGAGDAKTGNATSFSFPSPVLRIRVAGLSPSLRAKVAAAAPKTARLLDVAGADADVVIQSDAGQLVTYDGAGREVLSRTDTAVASRLLPRPLTYAQLALQLSAIDSPESLRGLSLQFVRNRPSFATDDTIQLRLRSDRGGYVTLIDLSTDGKLSLLVPSRAFHVDRLAPGRDVVFPGTDEQIIRAGLNSGVIRAIVTSVPLVIGYQGTVGQSSDDPQLPSKIRRALEGAIKSGATQWSTQTVAYSIHR